MKRAIITGATGFVGANLARRLLADGHDVHLLVRPRHRSWRIAAIRPAVQVHIVDFGDGEPCKPKFFIGIRLKCEFGANRFFERTDSGSKPIGKHNVIGITKRFVKFHVSINGDGNQIRTSI